MPEMNTKTIIIIAVVAVVAAFALFGTGIDMDWSQFGN
jgi:preprotein translocase subunit SecE|tara:strand:+ start:1740 stop:1853 length:114 start_codon:yes stop_codon:yes gene_type:complete